MSHVKEGTVGVQELAEEQGGFFLHRKGMDSLVNTLLLVAVVVVVVGRVSLSSRLCFERKRKEVGKVGLRQKCIHTAILYSLPCLTRLILRKKQRKETE
jgi:hypothetical protein